MPRFDVRGRHEAAIFASTQSKQLHMMPQAPSVDYVSAYQKLKRETEQMQPMQSTKPRPRTADTNWSVVLDPFLAAKRAERAERLMREAKEAEQEERLAYEALCNVASGLRRERRSLAAPKASSSNPFEVTSHKHAPFAAKARYAAIYRAVHA